MLEHNYKTTFDEIVAQTQYGIELPRSWQDYFEQTGEIPSFRGDRRAAVRMKVRVHGLWWFESRASFAGDVGRTADDAIGIYTRDFSRQGVGMLLPMQVYPEDVCRVVLPTFWMRAKVVRVRRLNAKCFETGCQLIQRFDPSDEAFPAAAVPAVQ